MKKLAFLSLAALLGALTTLVFARDEGGPWKVVFTEQTNYAVKRAPRKAGEDYWNSELLAAPLNQLASEGYEPRQVVVAEGRLVIVARKK